MNAPVHFMVGTGRCGSSLAHEMVCRHEDVHFISNLQDRLPQLGGRISSHNNRLYRSLPPWITEKGRARFAPSEAYDALARDVGPLLVDPHRDLLADDATDGLTERIRNFFVTPEDNGDGPACLVHKFTGWPRGRMLAEIYPEARFVQIIRDPRDVASSWLRMPWWRGHLGPEGWHFGPLSEQQQQDWERSGKSFSVLAALGWQIVIDAGVACKEALGDSWLDIRYEDLCLEPDKTMTEIAVHLGIAPSDHWFQQLERYDLSKPRDPVGRTWPELDSDIAAVEAACQPGRELFGYASSIEPSAGSS